MLSERFGDESRRSHAALRQRIDDLKASKKEVTGKGAKERKTEIDVQIDLLDSEFTQIVTRPPVRPTIGLWSGYRRINRQSAPPDVARSLFDHDILILSQVYGPTLPVESTLAVTKALRQTVLSKSSVQPAPAWVSGHLPDGQPLRDGNGHLALIPLPFVGGEHADGHLLGVALVFPRSVAPRERGRVLGEMLVNEKTGRSNVVKLVLGRLGVWEVKKRDWSESPQALQPDQWTTFPNGAETWASVTPVVLIGSPRPIDSIPRKDRRGKMRSGKSFANRAPVSFCPLPN